MRFVPPLESATLIRRYKRFLADVERDGEPPFTVHCPNTGAMLGCAEPGSRVWLHKAANPKRKYPYTWELVEVADDTVVGVNTGRANGLVREALEAGVIESLRHYTEIRAEVRFGLERSRVDFVLEADNVLPCYLEVKNVTATAAEGVALFPDAVSERGTKHLRELMALAQAGSARAVMVYCVQRRDVTEVRPADEIDPMYGRTLRAALAAGVEAYALRGSPSAEHISLDTLLPVVV
ncbi:MAG: DNA/RNA nuclease SfsA [Chromatiales bacterium]|jgi:sugar fermentation stimulation protein A|nr:DNA/RNA nuclease SfsA [Chromatiales bacterium]